LVGVGVADARDCGDNDADDRASVPPRLVSVALDLIVPLSADGIHRNWKRENGTHLLCGLATGIQLVVASPSLSVLENVPGGNTKWHL
jgi:hypothetical protein